MSRLECLSSEPPKSLVAYSDSTLVSEPDAQNTTPTPLPLSQRQSEIERSSQKKRYTKSSKLSALWGRIREMQVGKWF